MKASSGQGRSQTAVPSCSQQGAALRLKADSPEKKIKCGINSSERTFVNNNNNNNKSTHAPIKRTFCLLLLQLDD